MCYTLLIFISFFHFSNADLEEGLVLIYDPPNPFCSVDSTTCLGFVEIPFQIGTVSEPLPADIKFKVQIGWQHNNSVPLLDTIVGVDTFYLRGNFPIGQHELMVTLTEDQQDFSFIVPIEVVDCYVGQPLTPVGISTDGTSLLIKVSVNEFILEEVVDCSGPVEYSINLKGETPSIDQKELELNFCDHGEIVEVEIYTWDNAFNPYQLQPDSTVGGPNYSINKALILINDYGFVDCNFDNVYSIHGGVFTSGGESISNQLISLTNGEEHTFNLTNNIGGYSFSGLPENTPITIQPVSNENYYNGLSVLDIIKLRKHILGTGIIDDTYQLIAADVSNDKIVSVRDILQIQKLILGVTDSFPNNQAWRFVEDSYQFKNPTMPWKEDFPESVTIEGLTDSLNRIQLNWTAIKIGDVNESADIF